MRFLAIFKFDWSDKFDIAYIDVARSVTYDLVDFRISSMIDHISCCTNFLHSKGRKH